MRNVSSDKLCNYLLASIATAFLIFYLVLSFNNRLASDDIVFATLLKNQTVFDGVKTIYTTWSGRWTASAYFFMFIHFCKNFQTFHYYIFIYHALTLLILVYSVSTILRITLNKLLDMRLDLITTLVYSVLFIAGFYYSTFQHIEVWWWVSASFNHLQGLVFLLFGIALLLLKKKNIIHYALIISCFIYVGGCFEMCILIVFCLFVSVFLYFYLNSEKRLLSLKENYLLKGFTIAFVSFLLSATIFFSAPGNYERRNVFNRNNTISLSSRAANTLDISSNLFFQKKYLLALGLSALWLLVGMKIKSSTTAKRIEIKKILFYAAIPFLISVVIPFAFQYLILSGKPIPLRGWSFTSFTLYLWCCILFLMIGIVYNESKKYVLYFFKIALPFGVLIIIGTSAYNQYRYTRFYAEKYDALISDLIKENEKNNLTAFYVDPLPDSGMLVYLYLDSYAAKPLASLLNLNFEIKLKKK